MTEEEYRKSISTGELQLSFWNKVSHYGIVGFCFFIPTFLLLIHLFEFLKGNPAYFADREIYILIIPIIVGCLFFLLQKSRLKFRIIEVKVNPSDFNIYLEQLCKKWDWTPRSHNDNFFVAKTNQSFFSGSWGEQVTILRTENKIFINSICDLDKKSSVTSFGHNRENINAVKELFNNVSLLPK